MFDIEEVTAADLKGGRIADVVNEALVGGDDDYNAAVAARPDAAAQVLDAFEAAFGWRPPAEVGEYTAAEAALQAYAEEAEEFWMDELGGWIFTIDLCNLAPDAFEHGSWFSWANESPLADPMLLLAGMVQFGMDASGDTCWVSLLPHPDGIAEVWVYDHEVGEIDYHLGYSISETLLCQWLDDDDAPELHALSATTFEEDWERGRPTNLIGQYLFKRASWLISLLGGHEGYGFAARLGDAPGFDVWVAEKEAAQANPHLAYYWMFAHYFLGNTEACREAIEIASAHGTVGKALAMKVKRLVLSPGSALTDEIDGDRLAEFCELTRRNADPEQIDPASRAAIEQERGGTKADPDEVAAELEAGRSPMQIIEAHPDDVELHDEMLAKLAEHDEEFAELVEEYQDERTDDAYNDWPWDGSTPDARLSIPIAAAFRSGLKYSASHKKAFAGITRTLGKFDDDHALRAYREAMEQLEPADDRLEYVIEQLGESKHPEAHSVLVIGAERFFDNIDVLLAKKQARAKEWPTLDDMFRVDDYLIRALLGAMKTSDDHTEFQRKSVEKLARRTLAHGGALATLGVAWARAMQVVARYELDDLVYLAAGYIETFRDTIDHQNAEWMGDGMSLNLAESCRTLALRDPAAARELLRPIFKTKFGVRAYRADVIGALLAGLLIVEPMAPDVLDWTERILGSRCETRPIRLYGALVGVAEAKLIDARDWVWPHLWAGYSGISDGPSLIGATAMYTIEKLGVDPDEIPAFNDDDWYANRLKTEDELLVALGQPHCHGAEDVLERFREERVVSDAVATRVGDWFVDSLRYAEDDPDRLSHRDRWEALKVLLMQGGRAVPQFERIFALEHIGGEMLGYMVQFARCSPLYAHTMGWIDDADDDALLDALAKHRPLVAPFLDHVAAEALRRDLDCFEALRAANDWRFSFDYNYSLREDLVASRLPRLFGMLGKQGESYARAQREGAVTFADEFWDQALQFPDIPTPASRFDGDGVMVLAATSEATYDCTLSMKLELAGSSVSMTRSVANQHTRGVLDDAAWQGTYHREHSDSGAALEHANRLLERLVILGFTLT